MTNQLNHAEISVISALIASYPRPYSACTLIEQGLPDFNVGKNAALLATGQLQSLRLVRFKRGYLSLTKAGESAMTDVIAAVHSIH